MSGHSKWATIHRQKEAKDAKRGAAFTKLAAAITVAVKGGGGVADSQQNFRLRLAVDKARQFNMPKENIQRAIDRATGSGGEVVEEVIYEGFLPGGAAVIVPAMTDNKSRTAQQVREVVDKGGGTIASQGAVGYMFNQMGEFRVEANGLGDEDELKLIDAGVEEVEREEEEWVIYCDRNKTFEVKDHLEKMGYKVAGAELVWKPTSLVTLEKGDSEKGVAILEKLEELEDVQKVFTNADFNI